MMALNYLSAPRAIDKASDTLSEVSESGTQNSGLSRWDSREELKELVANLGLSGVGDLHQDRFRVDRRKLEHMLLGDNEAPEPADTFFHKVMEDTNTFITWPTKLKIGAKSKKDPHVRIAGRQEDVDIAKERILSILGSRNNRVTMKMDVSYTDHSHIIGRGGLSIKRVMEETQCHVHFPDSNRSNPTEKSNQVSITGDIEGVEKARSRVRNLTPLIFSFELPIMEPSKPIPDSNTPYVIRVQQQYNVQVMFKTRPKLHATLVLVKGVEWEVKSVKQATLTLVEYMCGPLANQISIHMSMEITPMHHSIVLGRGSYNLKTIMQRTKTQIMFPDVYDPNIPNLKKSNVTIIGNIHNVYLARQQLMGSLPLVLMFDLPEDTTDLPIGAEQLNEIMNELDLMIHMRHKAKQLTVSCVIKGIERNATKIYEARNRILGLKQPAIIADIPCTYLIPFLPPIFQKTFETTDTSFPPAVNINGTPSPNTAKNQAPNWPYPNGSGGGGGSPHLSPNSQHQHTQQQQQHHHQQQQQQNSLNVFNFSNVSGYMQANGHVGQQQTSTSFRNSIGESSGYQSMTSNLSMEQTNRERNGYSPNNSSPGSNPPSPRNLTPGYGRPEQSPSDVSDISSVYSDNGGYQTILLDYKLTDGRSESRASLPANAHALNTSGISVAAAEYEQRRLAGAKAMLNRPSPGGAYRHPTGAWAGYGISRTSPAGLFPDVGTAIHSSSSVGDAEEAIWKNNSNAGGGDVVAVAAAAAANTDGYVPKQQQQQQPSTSYAQSPTATSMDTGGGLLDHTPTHHRPDLTAMLKNMGLDKYVKLFENHEIDLTTFASLSEQDLIEVGVTAFGARRKMLIRIQELRRRRGSFQAAPGAERKSSSSSNSSPGW